MNFYSKWCMNIQINDSLLYLPLPLYSTYILYRKGQQTVSKKTANNHPPCDKKRVQCEKY